jgi:hypothetical protein
MRTFGIATVYVLGLIVLATVAANSSGWAALTGLGLAVVAWSWWLGFVARSWAALIVPVCCAGLGVAVTLALVGSASGDGGAESVAGILSIAAAFSLLQVVPIAAGVGMGRLLSGPAPPRKDDRTH